MGAPDSERGTVHEVREVGYASMAAERAEQLVPILYEELKRAARRQRRQLLGSTLTTTSLVHECYLRLRSHEAFDSEAHFLRVASVTMRHLIIDRARQQRALKRGGHSEHVPLEEAFDFVVEDHEAVLEVDEALQRLGRLAPRLARVVECRFFGGYSNQQIALVLNIAERTVERDWQLARAWLSRELDGSPP